MCVLWHFFSFGGTGTGTQKRRRKKRTQVCKVIRINHGVSKIFQGFIRWSTELLLKPNLSEYVNDERPFVFKIRKEGILRGTVSTMIYMLKREITKAKFKFISFVSSKYAFVMFSSRWSKDLTSLKKREITWESITLLIFLY